MRILRSLINEQYVQSSRSSQFTYNLKVIQSIVLFCFLNLMENIHTDGTVKNYTTKHTNLILTIENREIGNIGREP